MTLPTWPEDLPKPLRQSYQAGYVDPRKARAAEIGPLGYRRRTSAVARRVSLEIDCSFHQRALFVSFYEGQTAHGSLPFEMPDPTRDGWPLLDSSGRKMLDGGGSEILTSAIWTCLFGEGAPVEVVPAGIRFRIAFSVVVLP